MKEFVFISFSFSADGQLYVFDDYKTYKHI